MLRHRAGITSTIAIVFLLNDMNTITNTNTNTNADMNKDTHADTNTDTDTADLTSLDRI